MSDFDLVDWDESGDEELLTGLFPNIQKKVSQTEQQQFV